jgi:hypothetical protein
MKIWQCFQNCAQFLVCFFVITSDSCMKLNWNAIHSKNIQTWKLQFWFTSMFVGCFYYFPGTAQPQHQEFPSWIFDIRELPVHCVMHFQFSLVTAWKSTQNTHKTHTNLKKCTAAEHCYGTLWNRIAAVLWEYINNSNFKRSCTQYEIVFWKCIFQVGVHVFRLVQKYVSCWKVNCTAQSGIFFPYSLFNCNIPKMFSCNGCRF